MPGPVLGPVLGPLLVVQHEPECPPGLVGDGLQAAGVELDVRHPYAGQPLPPTLDRHSGLVVLGGHMGANDDAEVAWLGPTKSLIREAAADGIPALGICLGHQVAAVALGGVVIVNPRGHRHGVLPMGWAPDAAADPVLGACGASAVQWHDDIVSAPPTGTQVLARAKTGELLAARFAPTVWGVQCHPEAGPDIVARWADGDRATASSVGDSAARDAALSDVRRAAPELAEAWSPLARGFAAQLGA